MRPPGVEHALLRDRGRAARRDGQRRGRRARRRRCWRGGPQAAGVVYTLAYGDQPALICELVEWARLSGFEVVCAGKGTKHLPRLPRGHARNRVGALRPAAGADRGPQRADVLLVPRRHEVGRRDGGRRERHRSRAAGARPRLPALRHRRAGRASAAGADGGVLDRSGTLEVVSSLHPDGSPVPGDLRWGVYVTFAAADRFVAAAFAAYGVATSPTAAWPRSGARRTSWGSSSA